MSSQAELPAARSKPLSPPLPAGVRVESLCIPALEDAWALGALRFTHASCDAAQAHGRLGAAVVIAPATGVPARFYSHFAGWLASNGHPTTIFDYRMNGASYPALSDVAAVPKGANNDSARYTPEQRIACLRAHQGVGWAQYCARDVPAVLLEARKHAGPASKRELCYMGNSLGCHCLPAALAKLKAIGADADVDCKRALFIAGNSPHVNFATDPSQTKQLFLDFATMAEEEGYGATSKYGLGNDIPVGALQDWMVQAQEETYIATKPGFEQSFKKYSVPTLSVLFSDDHLARSPRMVDAFCRTLGSPTSVETAEEKAYWKGPSVESPDHAGVEAWRSGCAPRDPTRSSNSFTNTRLSLDVFANGWVKGSPAPPSSPCAAPERGEDARPKVVGHVDFARAAVWRDGEIPSARAWSVLKDWIADAKMPAHGDALFAGSGGRRDFGAPGDVAVEAAPVSRL